MVPKGWDIKKIDSFCNVTSSKRIMQSDYVESGIPFYRSKEIILKSKGIEPADIIYIETDKFYQLKKKFGAPQEGDILISAVGTLGVSYLVKSNEEFYFKDGNLLWLRELSGIEQSFLIQLMKSSYFKNEIQNMTAGSSQKALTIEKLSRMKLLTPPLREQQKIANILSTWDKAISTTERLIENSTQQKKALMQQLLTGKKRLLDESGKRFEGEWEEKALIDAGMTVTDGDRGKEYPNSSEFYDEGDYLFLSAKNVTKKGFLFEDTQFISKEKYEKLGKGIVNRGDVVLTTRGTVGQTAYYDDSVQYEFLRVNSGMVTLGCNNSELESNFFYALTNSSLFTRQVESLTFGSAQPQLTIKIIKSLKVPIPSIPEQQKIATVLTNADREIELLEQQLADLQQEKKALMQVLLTGKKRVVVDGE